MSKLTKDEIVAFFSDIWNLNYVVQRNWGSLPDSLGFAGHEDLDVLVHSKDEKEFRKMLKQYPKIEELTDVRTEKDGYYPKNLALEMLQGEDVYRDIIRIPQACSFFAGLYYHDHVHKGGGAYDLRLEFSRIFRATKPDDEGVGFHDFS